jgi:stress response protein YsnF
VNERLNRRRPMSTSDNKQLNSDEAVLPLKEETLRVEKRVVATGKVLVRTVADTVEELAEAELEGEEIEVTRVPVGRVVTQAPETRTEDGLTIVPVLEEVLYVEKQLVLKEELHIRRKISTETVSVPVSLRKQRAVVERVELNPNATSAEEREP